jgi:ABC-type Fe3+ transport system permease subunit
MLGYIEDKLALIKAQSRSITEKMARQRAPNSRHVMLLYTIGLYLLAVALLTPYSGYLDGKSFFEVAKASPWNQFWDWPAAWCSLKVIFLSAGLFLLTGSLGLFLSSVQRKSAAQAMQFLSLVPLLVFCLGLFYFVKALL